MTYHSHCICSLLPAAFSLMVLVQNWECQISAAEAVKAMVSRQVHADGSPSRPLNLPPGSCDNESGCMCRGATLAVSMDVAAFAPALAGKLAVPVDDEMIALDPRKSDLHAIFFTSPPLSGRRLRAHLASFLN